MDLHSHTRSVQDKIHDIWISEDRFTKNPDIVETKEGRLLLVYSDNDQHWSQINQVLTILASDDRGETWYKLSEVDEAKLQEGDERLVTPRLSALSDGRLAVLIDHDDFGHFHEEEPFGNWIYWSEDGGKTWSEHQETEIPGFEPDRIVELPDGRLSVLTHVMRGKSMEFALVMSISEDMGKTWKEYATVAHDGYHRFCEGALVVLDGGRELAALMRENHSAGFPNYVAFSRDGGLNWTCPQSLPFHFHRPYGKQLQDGRVMVTGRNLLGGVGTYAWAGDLKAEAGYYEIGGPMAHYDAKLEDGELVITNGEKYDCRYSLLPPQDVRSEVIFEADVRVEGEDNKPVAFLSIPGLSDRCAILYIMPNGVTFDPARAAVDLLGKADMRKTHHVTMHARRGWLTAEIDGKRLINVAYFHDAPSPVTDFYNPVPGLRLQFGQYGDEGKSYWGKVECRVSNPTFPDYHFRWDGADGKYPDHYQRERLTLIHANVHPKEKNCHACDLPAGPDHGYSSWLQQDDGTIVFVDYTNRGDKPHKSHLVGGRFRPEDI